MPIAYNIAWYEQKAVIVLLASLPGRKNIHLGPTLPAFLSPNVARFLVEKFGIAGIDTVDSDIELFMANNAAHVVVHGDVLYGDVCCVVVTLFSLL